MPPIYLMAALTLVASAVLLSGPVYVMAGRDRRYLWLLLPGLPLSALVNLAVKRPLIVSVGGAAGIPPGLGLATPVWFLVFVVLVAPLTEEAAKALPLLLPPARRLAGSRAGALWAGGMLGISFGLGEAAFIAYSVAGAPQFAGYPWYAFTGYFSERLAVCFAHGVLTAVLVTGLWRGWWRAPAGYLAAVALHAFLNMGAVLAQLGVISAAAAGLALAVPLVVLAAVFGWLRRAVLRQPGGPQAGEVIYFRRDEDGT
jgi:hypothetical protein